MPAEPAVNQQYVHHHHHQQQQQETAAAADPSLFQLQQQQQQSAPLPVPQPQAPVRIQLLPAGQQLSSAVRTAVTASPLTTHTVFSPAAAAAAAGVRPVGGGGNHVIKTVDGQSIIIRAASRPVTPVVQSAAAPAGSIQVSQSFLSSGLFCCSRNDLSLRECLFIFSCSIDRSYLLTIVSCFLFPDNDDDDDEWSQVVKNPNGTSQYMIIRKAAPTVVAATAASANSFRQLIPLSSPTAPQQVSRRPVTCPSIDRPLANTCPQIRISSQQIMQLKNAINNMNRERLANSAASGNPSSQPSSPIIIRDSHNLTQWSQQQQQLYSQQQQPLLQQQQKVIIRKQSSSGASSPNGAPGVSMSLLAAAGGQPQNSAGGALPAAAAAVKQEEEEMDDFAEDEDHFQAETYADYMPLKLKIGLKHPDPVVETASLSSVHPPNVWYRLAIGEDVIDTGKLSALQLEAITYACQQHEQFLKDGSRAGFLLGDGAGVGKGRTLAGIIQENYLLGRKRAIWLSVSNDLRYDAERDLRDIGAKKISVYPLNKVTCASYRL